LGGSAGVLRRHVWLLDDGLLNSDKWAYASFEIFHLKLKKAKTCIQNTSLLQEEETSSARLSYHLPTR